MLQVELGVRGAEIGDHLGVIGPHALDWLSHARAAVHNDPLLGNLDDTPVGTGHEPSLEARDRQRFRIHLNSARFRVSTEPRPAPVNLIQDCRRSPESVEVAGDAARRSVGRLTAVGRSRPVGGRGPPWRYAVISPEQAVGVLTPPDKDAHRPVPSAEAPTPRAPGTLVGHCSRATDAARAGRTGRPLLRRHRARRARPMLRR